MDTLIRLNVELKDSKAAKESLYQVRHEIPSTTRFIQFQYKVTCHSVNIKSLEDIIRKYISLAEARVEKAKEEGLALARERRKLQGLSTDVSDDSLLENIEDLESPEKSPEDLMLAAVTGEGDKERAETEVSLLLDNLALRLASVTTA